MRRLGILTGLASELRLILKTAAITPPPIYACAGVDPVRARREAERLIAEGAEALISFGLAGGLISRLRPGHIVLAEKTILPGGRAIEMDKEWAGRLLRLSSGSGLAIEAGAIAGSDRVVPTPDEKHALAAQTGALIVDMQTHALAEAAEAARVPVLAIRAVSDPADQAVPRIARGAVRPDGQVKTMKVLGMLCAAPWELPALLNLRRGQAAAFATLGRLIGLAGPALFGGD